jgi:hypothetical protein
VITALRRFGHDLLHAHEYQPGQVSGAVYERCENRLTGRVRVKRSEPGDHQNFQLVGGA